jgi:D-sedoheptulose 7-phosphate isomerase
MTADAAIAASHRPPRTDAKSTAESGAFDRLLALRSEANRVFFARESDRLARLCHLMAERFARGGRLIAIGQSPTARSDARHVAVEFVHPVIVGKRALPAIGVAGEGGDLERQVALLAAGDDIVMAFGADEDRGRAARAVAAARSRGCLTIAFSPAGAAWEFMAPSDDRLIRQELVETLYHLLWELVHVFFDHRGLLAGRSPRRVHDAGASAFLYPFLDEREHELEPVVADVRHSVALKGQEIAELRAQTLTENRAVILAAATTLRANRTTGAKVLAAGNGGSATDAMDTVADLHAAGHPAIDLTQDAAILTAIANDIGTEAIFSRQVIAHGQPGDLLITFSTSGGSANVISALTEARRRDLRTVALVGYGGGRVAAEQLADHVIVTRSEHIPRIQEAQASAVHVLMDLAR